MRSQVALRLWWAAAAGALCGCSAVIPAPPASSRSVAVDGALVQIDERHPAAPWPTVVMLSGHGALGVGWAHVRNALPADVHHLWIDRPGLGWSESALSTLTPQQHIHRMRQALREAGVRPPYLLAGHSLGGAFALLWAREHAEEVVGLVLVSPTTPGLWAGLDGPTRQQIAQWTQAAELWPWAARLGLLACWNPYDALASELPAVERQAARAFARSPRHLQAMAAEAKLTLPQGALMQALAGDPLPPDIAVEWLIESEPAGAIVSARAAEADALTKQVGAARLVVSVMHGADHVNMLTQAKHARLIAERLLAALAQARQSRRAHEPMSP